MIGSVAASCVLASTYLLGVQPFFKSISERANIALAVSNAKQTIRVTRERVQHLQLTNSELEKQLAGTHRLADRKQVNHTIGLVTERALHEGLIVESGTADDPQGSEMFAIVPIQLSGKGDFIAVTRFIRILAEDHPDIEVRSFALDSGALVSGGTSGFQIELAWYVLPE